MDNKEIAIITEGSSSIGLGHLMRCIAVAEHIKDLKLKPVFFVNRNKAVSEILRQYKFNFRKISSLEEFPAGSIMDIKGKSVLIDSKKDISGLIHSLKDRGHKVTILDNSTGARFYADNVIYPVAHFIPRGLKWKNAKSKIYYGAKYFPLRKQFKDAKSKKAGNYILVSMGGADPNNLTQLVMESIKSLPNNIKVVVLVTKAFRHKNILKYLKNNSKKKWKIIRDPKNFAKLLCSARLLITALGSTIYEAAYFGIPALVINNYETDLKDSRNLGKLGLCKSLGCYKNLRSQEIKEKVEDFLFSEKPLTPASARNCIPDANGARRITQLILN